jgi:hypothetical protein
MNPVEESHLSLYVGSALFAYVITMISALVVAKRSTNWRIRLLAFTVGMLPLCQAVILMSANHIWLPEQAGNVAQSLELLVCALCLTAIHLLNRENRDRRDTDARLRVAEAAPQPGSHAS